MPPMSTARVDFCGATCSSWAPKGTLVPWDRWEDRLDGERWHWRQPRSIEDAQDPKVPLKLSSLRA